MAYVHKICFIVLVSTIANVILTQEQLLANPHTSPSLKYTWHAIQPRLTQRGFSSSSSQGELVRNTLHILQVQKKSRAITSSVSCYSKTSALLYLSLLLLSNASDVEWNPGPNIKYPCQICIRPVTWRQRGVACDDCEQWCHVECMQMSTPVYEALAHSNVSWHCISCGMPQFSSSLFDSFQMETSNIFDSLTSSSQSSDTSTCSSTAPPSPGPPLATSSPTRRRSPKKVNYAKRKMKILNVNFQSIKNKKEEFGTLIDSTNPDIILGTETWLNSTICSSELFPPGYDVVRKDRADGYGGVCIAIKKDVIFEELTCRSDVDVEAIFTKIHLSRYQTLIICVMYRPPSSSTTYMDNLCNVVEDIHTQHRNAVLWLGGDLNLPDINWETHAIEGNQNPNATNARFMDMVQNCGLQQIVNFPTRQKNCLDLFLTNRPTLVDKCSPLPGIGDHDIVSVVSSVEALRRKPVKRKIFLWKLADMKNMKVECLAFQKDFTERHSSSSSIQAMWDDIKTSLTHLLNKHVPSKLTSTRYNQPWITRSVKRLTRKKKRSYNRAKSSNDRDDHEKYLKLKKQTIIACKEAYNDYLTDIISPDTTSNPKRFWSFINSKRCDASGVAPLKDSDGLTYSDSHSKANILSRQFSSVFNTNEDMTSLKDKGQSPFPAMDHITISPPGVFKILSDLEIHKATGPDEIPARLLKGLATELTPVLAVFFQASLNQGIIPDDWKKANVAPIFKKGDRSKPENYRPISLTSVTCKVLEHIVLSNVMTYLEDHNVLSDAQHGFRKKRSCVSQLVLAVQDLAKAIDDREQLDMVLLDFSKAFDKVPHGRLLHKLQFYGIRGHTHQWVSDFLNNRTQQVVLEGSISNTSHVTSGVPQGSVIGPMLFLLFINDLPEYLSPNSTVRLFADDCMLYHNIKIEEDALHLQEDIDALQRWESDWLMEFNPHKCQVLHVTNKRKPITKSYSIHGQILDSKSTAKYLGVELHKNLSWNHHINQVAKKANSTRAFLQRNIRPCPRRVKELCYHTLLQPIMEYASIIWDPHTQANIKKIEMVQRRYVRFIFNDHRRTSSVAAMLNQLKWPTLQERRAQAKMLMIYRITNSLVDIPQTLLTRSTCTLLHRGHSQKLMVPFARTLIFQRSFFPDSTRLWNSLPQHTIDCTSVNSFKQEVHKIQLR